MLAALLALVLVAAAPAMAQISNAVGGNSGTSGGVSSPFTANSTGNNSNQCATALQFGNTGNNQPAQGVLQYGSSSGGINETGGSFNFTPSNQQTCTQQVQQSSAASG